MTYKKTHPWIAFEFDSTRLPSTVWLRLGEAVSKCNHIAGVPLMPDFRDYLFQVFLAKGVQGTTAIEGNTLSEDEVEKQIRGELRLPPSREYLGIEVDNVVDACNEIIKNTFIDDHQPISVSDICRYNLMVLKKLEQNEGSVPGKLRNHSVGVGSYRAVNHSECEELLEKLCVWLEDLRPKTNDQNTIIVVGILRAIIAHIYIAWIHPFGDGNGRTARLIELRILLEAGVPIPTAQLLSNHYNATRTAYQRNIALTSKKPNSEGLYDFIKYAIDGFTDGLQQQLEWIRKAQHDMSWEHYIHQTYRDKNKSVDHRRRHLALDIARAYKDKPISIEQCRVITSRMSDHYAKKTLITVKRDLQEIEDEGLVIKEQNGFVPNKQRILAFLPIRKT